MMGKAKVLKELVAEGGLMPLGLRLQAQSHTGSHRFA